MKTAYYTTAAETAAATPNQRLYGILPPPARNAYSKQGLKNRIVMPTLRLDKLFFGAKRVALAVKHDYS